MSVRFILGRAGSGKSHTCLDEIRAQLQKQSAGSPLILLVPEQATFQAEYALVTTPGLSGIIRAQVLSFRRLAFRIMQEAGGTARIPITETGKKMLLHKILHKRKDELLLFYGAVNQMGFIDKLNELYTEFKRYCITAHKLGTHAQLHSEDDSDSKMEGNLAVPKDKLHDLLLIYQDYEQEIGRHYVDSEDYLASLAEQVAGSEYMADAEVWIDGFYGFTPQEFNVIAQLMKTCRRVNVTLCLDKPYEAAGRPDELELFHPTGMTMIRLQELAAELGVETEQTVRLDGADGGVLPRFRTSPMLAHLERSYGRSERRMPYTASLGNDPNNDPSNRPGVSLHTAVHRRAEVEGGAREILSLVRGGFCRWRDIAVMVRNIEDYHDLLSTVFKDFEIPYFFDQKRSVMHHPLVEFIRSALEVANNNWRYDAVFRCIKTEFLLPADSLQTLSQFRRDVDELENYALAFGIQGTRWTDSKPWDYKLRVSLEEESTGASVEESVRLEAINRTRRLIVDPLFTFQQQIAKADHVRDMAEALYDLLDLVHAPERLEAWSERCAQSGKLGQAREHKAIWGSVIDMLDELVEMMGDQDMPLDMFIRIMETGLESIKQGAVPPSLDQVLIGSMDRTRSSQIKYCFLLGVNDGIVPSRVAEDGVLSETEREQLAQFGLEMAPGSRRKLLDETFLIYTALTTPTEHLWLSYPLADEEGRSLLPSEVIRQVRNLFSELEQQFLLGEPSDQDPSEIQLRYAAHPERALTYLIVQLRKWKRGEEIASVWWELYNWFCLHPDWQDKLKKLLNALFYTNEEIPLSATTSLQLYGEHLRASVSRMERFVACPFAQFISHGLKLQERRIYRLEAPDIGQLFHAALSLIAMSLQNENLQWGALTSEQCRQRAEWAIDQLSPRLQSEILLSSKRHNYIARKLKDIVGRASVVLGEHSRRSSFTPIGLELAFGTDQPLPPLTFKLDNGCTMEIIGRIDRVDKAEDTQGLALRVIDYKSSRTSLNLGEVFYGLSLQMLTYLDIVVTHAEVWLGRKARPGGVLYFHVHNPLLRKDYAILPEEAEEELFKSFKMKGLVLGDRTIVNWMDATLDKGHSDIIPVALKTDGEFMKNSSVISEAQWNLLRKYTRKVITDIGTGISNGNVGIHPYQMGKRIACTHCNFKSVCKFDPLLEGNEYRPLRMKGKDEVWQALAETVADAGIRVEEDDEI